MQFCHRNVQTNSHVQGIYSLTLTAARLNIVFSRSSSMGQTEISQLHDGLP